MIGQKVIVSSTVELRGDRVVDVDGDDLPVGLALVDEPDEAEHFDGNDGAAQVHVGAEIEHVDRVVVTLRASQRVHHSRVLPRLRASAECSPS